MTKHTPGKWHWDGPVHDYDPKEEAPWLVNDTDDWVLKGSIQCFGEANARLIAAAPELLEALKILMMDRDVRDVIIIHDYESYLSLIAKTIEENHD